MWRGRGECGKKGLEKPRLGGRAFLAEAQQVQRQRGRDGTTGLTWCSLSTACAGTGWEQGRKEGELRMFHPCADEDLEAGHRCLVCNVYACVRSCFTLRPRGL